MDNDNVPPGLGIDKEWGEHDGGTLGGDKNNNYNQKIKTRLYEQILFIIKHGDSIGRNPVVMFFGIRTVTGIRENINYFSHRT